VILKEPEGRRQARPWPRRLALWTAAALASVALGCSDVVGVGLGMGSPYGPSTGGPSPWGGGTVWVGGGPQVAID
jgi:hypothetical protein